MKFLISATGLPELKQNVRLGSDFFMAFKITLCYKRKLLIFPPGFTLPLFLSREDAFEALAT